MTAILTEPAAAPRTTKNQSQRPPRKQSPAAGQPGKTRPQSSAAPVQDGPPEPVSGLLDFTGGRAFLRRAGYQRGPDDVAVSQAQVQQYGLRQGDAVDGTARPPRGGQAPGNRDSRARRETYPLLASVATINGIAPGQAAQRPEFAKLTPLYPQERLRLENGSSPGNPATGRIIDLLAPVGKGQRGLIVSPPKAGKTMVLQAIAAAVAANHPEVHLMVVLVGERPEEVTDLRRSVRGEVAYSTFDQSAEEHIQVAELAIERAKRLVELGRDVVVLLDSITRLGRAYNLAAPSSSRILQGGVAVGAMDAATGPARTARRRWPLAWHGRGGEQLPHGRRLLRGVQGHREHGTAAAPRPGREAHLPRDRRRAVQHPARRPAHDPRSTT